MSALVLEHLGHAVLLALGMAELDPQLPAALADTGVEFVNAAEAHLPRRLGSSLLPGTPWTRTCIRKALICASRHSHFALRCR
jgi:hypothetical protein